MLPLASLAARRLRNHHHICATCRIATRSRGATYASPALHLQQYGQFRRFSATLARSDDKTESSDASADSKPVKKRKKATPPAPQQKKTPKVTKLTAETTTEDAKPATKKKRDSSRNLKVLQGALAALKNVLDAQNISVAAPAAKSQKEPEGEQPAKKSERKRCEGRKASGKQAEGAAKQKAKLPKTRSSDKAGSAGLAHGHLQALRKALAAESLAEPSETGPEAKKKRRKAKDEVPADDKTPKASSSFVRKTKARVPKRRAHAKIKPSQEEDSPALDSSHDAMGIWQLESQTESAEAETPEGTSEISLVRKVSRKPLGQVDIKIESIHSDDLNLVPIEKAQPPVPPVSYGLDRVLFNPGVYHLQDPRSRVFNFDPYLSKIMPIQEFDFNALQQYITSSKDEALINIARENNKRYTGSTSSMTAMLAHFHYLLSSWREINPAVLSKSFNTPSNNFTKILTSPAAIFLHWKDGVYAIDADKEFDTANILSMLGKSMEKLLTLSKEDYERYRTVNSDQISEEERNADEAYHYTGLKDFMMRSQLDAHDPRIPGTGMFDLKTRAVISIRMDAEGFHKGLGYEIRNRFGDWESFEREYYDMIRSAFLKYSLQVRMGRMDGIFVAFHNTQRIFGFQYIPLPEMDLSLHGTSDTTLGDKEFKLSLGLLNEIMDRATKKFPEQSLRLHFETRPSEVAPFMYVFAKPVGDQEIKQVQEATKAKIEEFERNVLGLGSTNAGTTSSPDNEEAAKDIGFDEDVIMEDELDETLAETETSEASATKEVPDAAIWEDVRSKVEDAMEDDELGVAAVREAIEDALEQSGLLEGQSPEETRNYVDSLLNALSPDASPEQTEGVIADPDDVVDSQDHAEEQSVPDETADAEVSDEKPVEALDDAKFDDREPSAEESREDVNAESNTSSNEADSDPSVSIPIVETIALEGDQGVDSLTEESTSVTSPAAEMEVSGSRLDHGEQVEELKELSGTSGLSNLKDYIVRMAQNIDGKDVSERDMDDEDDSKLREFERILGQMMTGSRAASSSTAQASDAEDGLEESGDAAAEPSAPAAKPQAGEGEEAEPAQDKQLLGMVLTIRNRVNGSYVQRPEHLDQSDKWDIEYNIQNLPEGRAWVLYDKLCGRRRKALKHEGDRDAAWYEMFQGSLDKHTKAGRKFREEEEMRARQRPVHVVGEEEARSYEETFGGEAAEQTNTTEELEKEE
ncbi:mRNA degradation protein [Apiospora hydei]|uniref:mRNA degradation protein n=1 Tax=Apiospora hydei TaxID=1337664 RepID=A0ABR1V9L9_9PEZI